MAQNRRPVRRILTRLRSPVDRRVIFEAVFLLPVVSLALRTIGLARLQRRLERGTVVSSRQSVAEARHLANVVEAVVRRSPVRHNCLQRSVVLWRVLRRRNLEAHLRLGTRREGNAELAFHAWVEHGGVVLNDDQHVREQFLPFSANRSAKEH